MATKEKKYFVWHNDGDGYYKNEYQSLTEAVNNVRDGFITSGEIKYEVTEVIEK